MGRERFGRAIAGRTVVSLLIVLGVATGAAGCVASHPHPSGAAPASPAGRGRDGIASTPVVPGKATRLSVPGGVSVSLPAGAVRGVAQGDATLTATAIAPPRPAPPGMLLLGRTWEVQVSGGRLAGTATLRLPVPAIAGTPGGSQPGVVMVAYLDTATGSWTPVQASLDAAARVAVVRTPHLSVWSVISVDVNALAGQERHLLAELFGVNSTAQQPSCPATSAAAADGISVASSSGGLVKWCAGEEGGQAVLEVADNRSFGIELDYPSGWTVTKDGWPDIDTALADGMATILTVAPPGENKVIIGGGDTITFHIPLGASGTASAKPSSEAYLWSALLYGLGTLVKTTEAVPFTAAVATSTQVKAIQLVFTAKDCLSSFQGLAGTNVTSASSAASLFWQDLKLAAGCLGDAWKEAYGTQAWATAYIVGVFLWLINGLQLVGGGIYAAIQSGVYWNGYQMAVSVPLPILPCPTSGLSVAVDWGAHLVGLGHFYVPLEFTNTSGRTCTLYGYPGAALTASTTPGSQVGTAGIRFNRNVAGSAVTPALVTLAPDATASATLQLLNLGAYPSSSCAPVSVSYLEVYPPGQTSPTYVPYTGYIGYACSNPVPQLYISPVEAGTGG